jgi:hypothetical protein
MPVTTSFQLLVAIAAVVLFAVASSSGWDSSTPAISSWSVAVIQAPQDIPWD